MPNASPIPTSSRVATVALVGNPNTGKSTVFNALTGFRQRVGNYPGITVEKRIGALRSPRKDRKVALVDLPGTYSLGARGEDESVVLDVLLGRQAGVDPIELIVVVVDAVHLSRNLFLTSQLLELGLPIVVALNMIDLATAAGIRIDTQALQAELGVPVIPVAAKKNEGVEALSAAIQDTLTSSPPEAIAVFPESVQRELDGLIQSLSPRAGETAGRITRAEALQALLDPDGYHERRLLDRFGHELATDLLERRQRIEAAGESPIEAEARVRYAAIDETVRRVVQRPPPPRRSLSDRIDAVLTHRIIGLAIFLVVMASCFQAIYAWAAPLMEAVDAAFVTVGAWIAQAVPSGALQSLVVNGVVAGVGAVLVFLPQILILFLFIAILEDCGYMARAAFLLDRWMAMIGLNGKSFIPLLSSFACAVPGIMATRTIDNRRERFVTILIAPLMSCSARLPVYTLLIGAFVPSTPLFGKLVNLQAVTLLGLYLVGITVAIPVALLLKRTVLSGVPQSFLLELPSYKRPSIRLVAYRVYEQGREFCVSAGTVIFAVTVIVWALGYYPRPAAIATTHDAQRAAARATFQDRLSAIAATLPPATSPDAERSNEGIASAIAQIQEIERALTQQAASASDAARKASRREADRRIQAVSQSTEPLGVSAHGVALAQSQLDEAITRINRSQAGAYLRQSALGRMGHWIEPLVRPIGWDWRIGTAVIASFPAREVVIATMGTIYNLGGDEDETSTGLREQLRSATGPDGRPVFNLAVALSIMVFFALCCQCAATLATIKRETNSWRWPLGTFAYMTVIAYLAALLTYRVALPWV